MGKRNVVIIIVIATILFASCFGYYKFKYNEMNEEYSWITLRNIYSTLEDIVYTYETQYQNQSINENEIKYNLIFREYFNQLNTYGWYAQASNRLGDIDLEISKLSDIDDDGISLKEIKYLVTVLDKLDVYIHKINDEFNEVSVKRLFGVFHGSNVKELENIFDDNSLE